MCVCVCVCVCVMCKVGWHAEFVIALPHVKDWPRVCAVYLWPPLFAVCEWAGGRATAGNDQVGGKHTYRKVQNNVHTWKAGKLLRTSRCRFITHDPEYFSCHLNFRNTESLCNVTQHHPNHITYSTCTQRMCLGYLKSHISLIHLMFWIHFYLLQQYMF